MKICCLFELPCYPHFNIVATELRWVTLSQSLCLSLINLTGLLLGQNGGMNQLSHSELLGEGSGERCNNNNNYYYCPLPSFQFYLRYWYRDTQKFPPSFLLWMIIAIPFQKTLTSLLALNLRATIFQVRKSVCCSPLGFCPCAPFRLDFVLGVFFLPSCLLMKQQK